MSRALALLVLLSSGQHARADAPWAVSIGAGPAVHRVTGISMSDTPMIETSTRLGASASLNAGYRVANSVALGAHLGVGYVHAARYEPYIASSSTYALLEAGIGAQLAIADRVYLGPWIGFLDTAETRFRACGVALGFDVIVRGHDRISAAATFATAGTDGFGFTDNGRPADHTFGAGLAYRYW